MDFTGKYLRIAPTPKSDEPTQDILLCIEDYNIDLNADSTDKVNILKSRQMYDKGVCGELSLGVSFYSSDSFYQRQHIYLITNDPIRPGDYIFDDYPGNGKQIRQCHIPAAMDEGMYKIVATTDLLFDGVGQPVDLLDANEINQCIREYNEIYKKY